jgi:hypothetical protein
MPEWCMAHPWMTFFIAMAALPTITIDWRRGRKGE